LVLVDEKSKNIQILKKTKLSRPFEKKGGNAYSCLLQAPYFGILLKGCLVITAPIRHHLWTTEANKSTK